MEYTATSCSSCGTNPEDWYEYDEEGRKVLAEPAPYKPVSVKCYGCVALEEARAKVGGDKHDRSVTFRLRKVSRTEGMKELQEWQMNR